jgi:hypothetical protein
VRSFVALFLVAAVTVMSVGCDRGFEQAVSVTVLGPSGKVLPNVALRYHSEGACTGTFIPATTSTDGVATFSRRATRGGVSVLLEEPSLCFEREGKWYAAWQEFIDPADRERFACGAAPGGDLYCERLSPGGGT